MPPIRTLIMGAAGRDFHNFNVFFRGNLAYVVVAFTAAQIPNMEGRIYPPVLAGAAYPAGIPIYWEADLDRLTPSAAFTFMRSATPPAGGSASVKATTWTWRRS